MLKQSGWAIFMFSGLMLVSLGCNNSGPPVITAPPASNTNVEPMASPPGTGAAGQQRTRGGSSPAVQSPGVAPD